ncbi:unnamed protein product [Phytomonas sp. Hart1]|nr:unnamed protein product [Phytomonas sp. Hart1]|eukprot:CCW66400.1 unnamed protein product [Phytomonas sp. isolate Hart1]
MQGHSYPTSGQDPKNILSSDGSQAFLSVPEASKIAYPNITSITRYNNFNRSTHSLSNITGYMASSVPATQIGNYKAIATAQSTTSGVGGGSSTNTEADEEELDQLLRELQSLINSPYALAVLQNILEVIEARALCNFDPLFRDTFLESRIRDILIELTTPGTEQSIVLALNLIEGLLPIRYTHPQQKFTRLCRSLTAVMECDLAQPSIDAQEFYKQMLRLDMQFDDPPLLTFVPKDLKDRCEHALMQLDGQLQQTNARFHLKCMSILLAGAATVEINPHYIGNQLRNQLMMLAMVLSSSDDTTLCTAAYDCLCAIFHNTSYMRRNEISLESRCICEEAIRVLSNKHHNEASIVSTLTRLRALLSSRELGNINKHTTSQLCVLITELYRNTESAAVRLSVCKLVPIIAPIDLYHAQRRSSYCAIIMKPVKNIRDERSKSDELNNVAVFIENAGYGDLDAANRTNIDSIIHRYISRVETQEICWRIIAAICQSNANNPFPQGSSSRTGSLCARRSLVCTPSCDAPSLTQTMLASQMEDSNATEFSTLGKELKNLHTKDAPSVPVGFSPVIKGIQKTFMPTMTSTEGVVSTTTPQVQSQHGENTSKYMNRLQKISTGTSSSDVPFTDSVTLHINSPSSQNLSCNYPTDANTANAAGTVEMIRRCIPCIVHAALTRNLVQYIGIIQKLVPSLSDDIERCLDKLVDRTLEKFAKSNIDSDHARRTSIKTDTAHASTSQNASHRDITLDAKHTSPTCITPLSHFLSSNHITTGDDLTDTISRTNTQKNEQKDGFPSHLSSSLYSTPLSRNLTRIPAGHSFTPTDLKSSTTTHGLCQSVHSLQPTGKPKYDLTVALECFARRPVTSVQKLEAIKTVIMPFQRNADPTVRQKSSEAIIVSLIEWIQYAKEHKTSTYSTRVIEILESYLKNAVSEMNPTCRHREITLLADAPSLRPFLCESHTLSTLLSFLNCEPLVREKTVILLVSLIQDPKLSNYMISVKQSLYVAIESYIVVLEHTNETRTLIRSLTDLQIFAYYCVRLLNNHLCRILYAFRRRLQEDNIPDSVSLTILITLDKILSALVKEEKTVLQYQDDFSEIYPSVVSVFIQTPLLVIRHAAVNVLMNLNHMCPASMVLMEEKHHELIGILGNVYNANQCTREGLSNILTLFGQLGAVDPPSNPIAVKKNKTEGTFAQDEADSDLMFDCTAIVYRTLCRMLDLSMSEAVHSQTLRTLLDFIRCTQDSREVVDGVHAVQAVLHVLKCFTDSLPLRLEALHVLAGIIALKHDRVSRVMLPEIVVLLEQLWIPNDIVLFRAVLEVVEALRPGKLSGKEHLETWAWLYPRLTDAALQDHTETHEFCLHVIDIILNASYIPPHCMNIVFPMLMHFVKQTDLLVEVRSQSLCAAVHIVCELKATQYLPSLIQGISTFSRHCDINKELASQICTPNVRESLRMLSTLQFGGRSIIKHLRDRILGVDGCGFSGSPALTLSAAGRNQNYILGRASGQSYWNTVVQSSSSALSSSTHMSVRTDSATGGITGRSFIQHKHPELLRADDDAMPSSLMLGNADPSQDLVLFMKHIESGERVKENKLREWFAELQKWIILVAPHPAFRVLVNLFDKHEQLRRELFYPSFKVLYEMLSAEQIKKVDVVLTLVLNSNDADLSSKCLGLVDYLNHNTPKISKEVLDELSNLERNDNGKVFIHATDAGPVRQNFNPNWNMWHGYPFIHNNEQIQKASSSTSTNTVGDLKANDVLTEKGSQICTHVDNVEVPLLSDSCVSLLNISRHDKESGCYHKPKEGVEEEQHDELSEIKSITGGDELMFPKETPTNLTIGSQGPPICVPNISSSNRSINFLQKDSPIPHGELSTCKTNILFSTKDIIMASKRTRMHDKALSYLECNLQHVLNVYRYRELPREVIKKNVWPLAWVYSQREMQDSVVGLFKTIRYVGSDDDGFRFELLRWWERAKQAYQKAFQGDPIGPSVNSGIVEGYVRTLCFCAEWDKALAVVKQVYVHNSHVFSQTARSTHTPGTVNISSTVAQCGALSAWVLERWDDVTQLAECISPSEGNNAAIRLFFLNVAQLHSSIVEGATSSYGSLRRLFSEGKMVVDKSLCTLMPLSYSHAYENIALLQHFTEMEETLDYTLCRSTKRRSQFIERWNKRFLHLKPDSLYPSLHSLLLHSLVLSRSEMSNMMLHFCESMSAEYPKLAIWAMNWLWRGISSSHTDGEPPPIHTSDMQKSDPSVVVGYISHLCCQGHRQAAIFYMERYLMDHGKELEVRDPDCYGGAHLKLGMWKQDLHADCFWMKEYCDTVLAHFHEAIRAMPHSFEAWHSWGLMNYRIQQREHRFTLSEFQRFVEAAHQGFVAAICRCKSPSEALPGIMRLLQLWVLHNGVAFLKEMVADSISRIPVDHWVQSIPQLIGYLGNDCHDVREMISMILKSLCRKHPQAVVFPLLVVLIPDDMCINTDPQLLLKRELVRSIIQHCPIRIRNEAETVAKLLVEVSAIPIEKIRENLSRVATAWNPNAEYEDDRDEVHQRLKATLDIFEVNRRHLLYTVGDIGQFVRMVIDDDLRGQREKATGIVNQLVDEITKHISEKLGREPQKAMEPLLRLRNCAIAVFGEYDIENVNYPTIVSFSSELDVIPSKKRPRRIQLNGSDGCLYSYCLKGNEDIRMDERVMQLFGMVNILLSHMRMPSRADIHRFPVIPITSNVGLLGWVKDARTINNTICNYRSTISHQRTHHEANVLHHYVESFGQWEKLSIIQRTEALDFVMSQKNCNAVDVARTMWYRANTAEQWLDLRIVYTTSLATMSLVGYVLGLGDRHLGNILLSMSTGKIVHIDFGDSFDVGRLRHVLPETVPFRLTRMLTNAMEVFGVNGVFRASATRTQSVLSQNRDSIMALLSAFVYDAIMQHKGNVKNIMDKSRSPQNIVERTRNKLRGREMALPNARMTIYNTTPESCRRPDLLFMSKAFDDSAVRDQSLGMTPEMQVGFLIDEATRIDNHTTMYFGWGPLW